MKPSMLTLCGCFPLVLSVSTLVLPMTAGCILPPVVSGDQVAAPDRGDLNADGVIDQKDLDLLTAAFGSSQGDPRFVPEADFDGDGVIGLNDLQTLVWLMEEQAKADGN